MPQSFSIAGLTFHFYGLFLCLGLLVSYFYSSKKKNLFGLKQKDIDITYVFGVIFSIIGARLYHVFDQWAYYKNNLIEIFKIWNGGLGIFGALIGSIFGVFFAAKIYKLKLINLLNLIFPSILLSQSIGRIGNFFNHEAYGLNNRPVFLYESILCLLAFLLFVFFIKKKRLGFAYCLISYGLIRIFTESFRIDTWTIFSFKIAYFFSILMIVAGIFFMVYFFDEDFRDRSGNSDNRNRTC